MYKCIFHAATCGYWTPSLQVKVNVNLNLETPNDKISLKRQLRVLIIEIQRAIAKIKMIKFRNRSLWNCQIYKSPLKEIVINIEVNATEIEKLIATDKKRSRDKHEFASTWYGKYQENSLKNRTTSIDKQRNPKHDTSELTKSSEYVSQFPQSSRTNQVKKDSKIRNNNEKENKTISVGKINKESLKTSKDDTKSKTDILKFLEQTEEIQTHTISSKNLKKSQEIFSNEVTVENQNDRNVNNYYNFTETPYLFTEKTISKKDTTTNSTTKQRNSDVLIVEKNNETNSMSCSCKSHKNLKKTIYKRKDATNKKFDNAKSSCMNKLTENTNLCKDSSHDENWNNIIISKKQIKLRQHRHHIVRKNFDEIVNKSDNNFEEINGKHVNTYKISDDGKFSTAETSMKVEDLHAKYSSVNENLNLNNQSERHRRKTKNAPQHFNNLRKVPIEYDKEQRSFDEQVSVIRNESKIDESESNSMDVLIDGVDEVLPADASQTAARNSKNSNSRVVHWDEE